MFEMLAEKRKFEADVIERAYKDPDFREKLRNAPQEALAEAYGRSFPWNIEIHSDSQQTMHLVLPVFEDEMDDELSEEMLDHVSGGCGIWTCVFLTF